MTIGINIAVPEGIVFAADSRQTYANARGDIRVSSDNAQKLFQLTPWAGAITWGWAFLLGRNIHSHVNDFRVSQASQATTVEGLARSLGQYMQQQYLAHIEKGSDKAVAEGQYAFALFVAGYDPGHKSGKVFEVYVPEGEYHLRRTTDENPGAAWRGHYIPVSRLLNGFDPRLSDLTGYSEELGESLNEYKLAYQIDYWSMTLQDAVDLAAFLVHTTITMERFSDGIGMAPGSSAVCGGAIDIAVIQPDNGFEWVQRKALQGERPSKIIFNSET